MKISLSRLIVLLCTLVLVFSACSKRSGNVEARLLKVQTLGDTNPRAAMAALDSLREEVKQAGDERLQYKFMLLHNRLRDKADILPVSTDTMTAVCEYFEHHGTVGEKAEAQYYLASVYRDLQDYPQATVHFLQAANLAEEATEPDAKLLERTYSQLAYLYSIEYNYDESLNAAKRCLDVAEKHHLDATISTMDVATAYLQKGDTLAGLKYCDKAWETIKGTDDVAAFADITAELLTVYSERGASRPARECFERLQQIPAERRPHNFLYGVANYYDAFGPNDSIEAAFRTLYDSIGTWTGVAYAAGRLTKFYHDLGRYKEACAYALDYKEANEHQLQEKMLELTARARGEYVYQRSKEAEVQAVRQAGRLKVRLWTSIAVFALLVAALLAFALSNRRKALRKMMRKDAKIASIEGMLGKREELLQQKTAQLSDLERQLDEVNVQLEAKDHQLRERMAQLNSLIKVAIMEEEISKGTEVMEKFREAVANPRIRLSAADWKSLLAKVDSLYPGFIAEVQVRSPKGGKEIVRTASLLKLGFTNPEIAIIMDTPRQTVWHRVTKLKKQLGDLLDVAGREGDNGQSLP